jgi:hypothetical protein
VRGSVADAVLTVDPAQPRMGYVGLVLRDLLSRPGSNQVAPVATRKQGRLSSCVTTRQQSQSSCAENLLGG